MQFQSYWWQRHWDISVSNRILWPHGYASQISKSDWSSPYEVYEHLCIFGRYINCNQRIFGTTQTKVTISSEKEEENLAISLDKGKFFKQVEWLGFNFNSEVANSLIKKTEAIEKTITAKNFSNNYKVLWAPYTISHNIYQSWHKPLPPYADC